MPHTRPLLLNNARLIDPASKRDAMGGLLIIDGMIADLGAHISRGNAPESAEIYDCHGAILAPGLVDLRAFTGEPGAEHRETLKTASEAAAKGGITSLLSSAETDPVVDDPAIVDFIQRRARDTAIVNIYPSATLTKGAHGKEMTEIGLLKQAGARAFSDGAKAIKNAQVMRRALSYASMFDALIIHHIEDPDLAAEGVMNESELSSRLGLPGIPKAAETLMLERDLALLRLTGGRYHASILSCAESLESVKRAKDAGVIFTAGTSINHLCLNENDLQPYRTFLKLSPPLRGEDDRQALVEGLTSGLIDVICSDHNPQDVETKRQPFAECANGAVGLETMLAAGLRLVHAGDVSLHTLLHAMSTRPAELLGLNAGRLQKGYAADLIVLDADRPFVVDPIQLRSRCRNTPFDGARLSGEVLLTIVGGKIVHRAE